MGMGRVISQRGNTMELWANTLLFLSSLLLLIDIAPRDFLPSHRRRVAAVFDLRRHRNIVGPIPAGVRLRPVGNMGMVRDEAAYRTLIDFIQQRSALSGNVDWGRAMAVGYSTISMPVAGSTLEAFHPLYVALTPPGTEDQLELVPVGQLEDLDRWLQEWRQGSMTRAALVLLAAGFLLQLWPAMAHFWSEAFRRR